MHFFIRLAIRRVAHSIISIINLPQQTDTYIDELVEIFLKLSMKTVQVHLIFGTTLIMSVLSNTLYSTSLICRRLTAVKSILVEFTPTQSHGLWPKSCLHTDCMQLCKKKYTTVTEMTHLYLLE